MRMKIRFAIVCALAWAGQAAAQSSPLFDSGEVLELTLVADFAALEGDRGEVSPRRPAVLWTASADGAAVGLEVTVRTRGNFRLRRSTCAFPNLRIDFGEGAGSTAFAGQDALKLVAHCRNTDDYEQNALEELHERILKAPSRLKGTLGAVSSTPPEARIEQNFGHITRLFASDELEEVIAALEAEETDWAQTELQTLRSKSPLSCKVSLRLLAEGADRASFAEEMRAEYALAGRIVRTHDFREGVRALLIDKDNSPHWDPPVPELVDDEMLDILFAPLPPNEQWTPFPETGE